MVPSRRPSAERVLAALSSQLAELDRPLPAGLAGGAHTRGARAGGARAVRDLQSACVDAVLAAAGAGQRPQPDAARIAVRYMLDLLAAAIPGRAVEVRVPPYGAVQCVPGPTHTRGTPPNVVETDPVNWLRLATGDLTWQDGILRGVIRASGPRADLSPYLPISR
jgi:Bacterial SCP ortholog